MQVLGGQMELALCEAMQFEIQVTQSYTHIRVCPCCAVQFILCCHANKAMIFFEQFLFTHPHSFTHSRHETQERFKDWEPHLRS